MQQKSIAIVGNSRNKSSIGISSSLNKVGLQIRVFRIARFKRVIGASHQYKGYNEKKEDWSTHLPSDSCEQGWHTFQANVGEDTLRLYWEG